MKFYSFLDAPESWQLGLQDPATPVMEGIIDFHDELMFYLIVIVTFVTWLLGRCTYLYYYKRHPIPEKFVHGTTIEIVWTIIPALVLMLIAMPSFALLYSIEEVVDPAMTVKVVGHQWYWSYEYGLTPINYSAESSDEKASSFLNQKVALPSVEIDEDIAAFDSYMIPENDLTKGALRLLETDRRLVLPEKTHIRCIVTSADVLHSWAVPSFGVKIDACPGRLNQVTVFIKREGVFYGQCSEICGVNHGFMPIVVEVTSQDKFLNYINPEFNIDNFQPSVLSVSSALSCLNEVDFNNTYINQENKTN